MKAKIFDETVYEGQQRLGVNVDDKVGVEHQISMDRRGVIHIHEQEGYPDDPEDRTNEGNEHVNQAARYAKYYVYRERGYDTLAPYQNPDRIATLAVVIQSMNTGTFAEYFGDLYKQIRSHHTDEQPPRSLPVEITQDDVLFYRQNVSLGLDEDDVCHLAALFDQEAFQSFFDEVAELSDEDTESVSDQLEALARDLGRDVDPNALPEDLLIDAVSGIHVRWDAGLTEHIDRGAEPSDDDPDVRLELFPHAYHPDSLEEFQRQLVHHLKCQIRDCYVGMGVTPPESVQLTGPGIYKYSNWYQHHDVYQPYHDPDADIDWDALDAEAATVE